MKTLFASLAVIAALAVNAVHAGSLAPAPPDHRQVRAGLHGAFRRPDAPGAPGHGHRALLPDRRAVAARPGQQPALRHHCRRPGHPAPLGDRAHRAPERRQPGHSRRQRGARRAQCRAAQRSGRLRGARAHAPAEPGRRRRLAGQRLLGRGGRQGGAPERRRGRPRPPGDHRAEPRVQPLRLAGGRRLQRGAERQRRRQHGLGHSAR